MGGMTDGVIRQALKRVEVSGKQENLTDGEGRGTGRLVLIVRATLRRVIADFSCPRGGPHNLWTGPIGPVSQPCALRTPYRESGFVQRPAPAIDTNSDCYEADTLKSRNV